MASVLTDFINSELYPALFGVIDRAFPEMSFSRCRDGWKSPCYLDGSRHAHRQDKTVITHRKPNRILEQGGESLSLIDFQMRRTGKPLIEAIRSLCNEAGLSLPDGDTEEYKAYKERQEAIEQAAIGMQKALFTPDGAEVLQYLRKNRGYSDELIKTMGLGVITEASARDLNARNVVSLSYGIGTDFVLAIPYTSGGSIRGFKFRSIDGRKDKYRNSNGLPKKVSLFGLTGLRLTGDGAKDRDLTIVEGELDALHAQAIGIDNVVAAAGGEISPEAIAEAKAKGVRRVTILFDTEDTAEGQINTDRKRRKAIETINASGLTPFVVELPSDGSKVDVDSYLLNHTKEELSGLIDQAITGSMYLFQGITKDAIERQGGEDQDCTFKNLHEYKRQTIQLANSPYITPTERDTILREFSLNTGEYISKESLQEEADAIKALQDADTQKQETIKTAEKVLNLARAGRAEEAITLMGETSSTLRTISREGEYSRRLILPTAEGIKTKLRNQPTGVKTPYSFGSGDKEQQLILPSGALTFVCAPTSHGKSTMLRNIALSVAQDGQQGAVLYFTYEETEEEVIIKAENTFIGEYISKNNLRTIATYNAKGEYYGAREGLSLEKFRQKETLYLSLLTSGKLRIFYEDSNDSNDLISLIRYLCKELQVKAIFVDYIQKLKKRNTRLQRREELGEIADDFMKLAISLRLPIVMAAQLNREAKSPIEMHSQNIAEAADIERAANTIICLWNSSFTPNVKSDWDSSEKGKGKTAEQKHIEGLGFTMGTAGQMYGKLTKNRGGVAGLDAVLSFDGNAGVVKGNYTPDPFSSMTQQDLPLPPSSDDGEDLLECL